MSVILAALAARFNALPFKLIAIGAAVLVVLLVLFGVYREGKHSAEKAAAVELAKHNAAVAAKYMKDAKSAQDIAGRERARAENLASQVATLKEQVSHVAQGNASPGVDSAIHGVRKPDPTVGKPAVPGFKR